MPPGAGSSPVTYATTKLSYPIFDCEFDPYNRGYLIVGGGGGENRTGVPNKLTLLDVSERHAVEEVAEVNLSVDEDSPQTLSSLTTKRGLITLAGISSSSTDQKAGKNEHLRSFDVEFPPKKRAKIDQDADTSKPDPKAARLTLASKSQMFHPPPSTFRNPRTYQRLLRLSPVKSREVSAKRIGAIGTADAASNEIVLFDATTFMPNASSVLQRIPLDTEAEDLDLFEYEEGSFGLAYCTNYEIYLFLVTCDFSKKGSDAISKEPVLVHSVPQTKGSPRPKIRCLRWVSDEHLVILQNTQPGGRPELLVLHFDPSAAKSTIIQRRSLPKSMTIGIRLATCHLDTDPASGERQIVLAVAGQNKTVHILTLNHNPSGPSSEKISPLQAFNVLDVSPQHPQSISKIAFSNFFPPRQPVDSPRSVAGDTQYIQLCSVSVGWTVSVETLALTSTPTAPTLTSADPVAQKAANPNPRPSVRWVLSTRHSELLRSWAGTIIAAIVVLILGIMAQGYIASEKDRAASLKPLSGILGKFSGVAANVNPGIASKASRASSVLEDVPVSVSAEAAAASMAGSGSGSGSAHSLHSLRDLLHLHRHQLHDPSSKKGDTGKTVLLNAPAKDNPYAKPEVSAQVHHSLEELRAQGAKSFEELSETERQRWKERLKAAGQWSEKEGVTVLKSVLFAEWAHVVGGALRDVAMGA